MAKCVQIFKMLMLITAIGASAASAQGLWPALYDVTGVASDDALNMRAHANATSEIIGTLAHDQKDVEVAFPSEDGKWGAVNFGERSGWVRLSYLKPHPGNWTEQPVLFGQCFGTEPFWSLRYHDSEAGVLILKTPEETLSPNLKGRYTSANRIDRISLVAGPHDAPPSSVFILRSEICSDGMSDRYFGLGLDILYRSNDGAQMLSGCCSLTGN